MLHFCLFGLYYGKLSLYFDAKPENHVLNTIFFRRTVSGIDFSTDIRLETVNYATNKNPPDLGLSGRFCQKSKLIHGIISRRASLLIPFQP